MTAAPPPWHRSPGRGGYVRAEVERRFRVTARPPALHGCREVEDRYVDGTTLRLRRVSGDGHVVHKLTQKVRPDPHDPAVVAVTNTYLSAAEHGLLAALPAHVVTKTRCAAAGGLVVDDFGGHLVGLVLAEVEVGELAGRLVLPPWVGREVTHEDRWSGGSLGRATAGDVGRLLSEPAAAEPVTGDDVRVVAADPSERADAVTAVHERAATVAYRGLFATPFPRDEVRRRWAGHAGRLVVATHRRGAIGFAAATGTTLDALYVLPEDAGTGVGSALLDAVGPVDRLWVLEGNAAGRAWYEARGWAWSGTAQHADDADGLRELLYERAG